MAKANEINNQPLTDDTQQGDSSKLAYELLQHGFDDDDWMTKIGKNPSVLPISVKEVCFHNLDSKSRPTGVNDKRIFDYLVNTQHIFTCDGVPYIYIGGYYHMDLRGEIIMSLIKRCCLETYVKSTTNKRVFNLFSQEYEIVKAAEDLNAYSSQYINFENGMYDSKRRLLFPHTPKINSVNQIPWKYDPNGDHGSGVEMEKFLKQAIPDPNDREMLLEYIGLCCTKDVTQQKMLVICGDGGTGKSTIINLIQEIVGAQNTSNVALSRLSERFEAISMRGKLLNSCADLEIDALDDVTMVKKLIGEDTIHDCYKGKDPISFKNYAKLLFSTNELPLVRNEKTDGFYRRLMVLTMNEKPPIRDPELPKRLAAELPYLIHLAMEALYRMYNRPDMRIFESENSKEKVAQLRRDSDTIESFLSEFYVRTNDPSYRIERGAMFEKYIDYCDELERHAHSKHNFFKALRNKGFQETRDAKNRYFTGLRVKTETDSEVEERREPSKKETKESENWIDYSQVDLENPFEFS
jgi:P4 family phage/plasmid primase-like protien